MSKEEKKWKKAVWQYLLDHATVSPVGFKCYIAVKSEADFWRRVRARQNGFKRNESTQLEDKAKFVSSDYQRMKRADVMNKRWTVKMSNLKENGNIAIKILFFIKKIISKYLEKKCQKYLKQEESSLPKKKKEQWSYTMKGTR